MMSSTISTSRPSIESSRSLRIRTTPPVAGEPPRAAGGGEGAVGGDRHEVDRARHVQVAHQVGQEEDGALQHPHEEQLTALVVGADLRAELSDPVRKIAALHEGPADGRVVHGRHPTRRAEKPSAATRSPTQTTRPPASTTGTRSRSSRGIFSSVKRSWSFFVPPGVRM